MEEYINEKVKEIRRNYFVPNDIEEIAISNDLSYLEFLISKKEVREKYFFPSFSPEIRELLSSVSFNEYINFWNGGAPFKYLIKKDEIEKNVIPPIILHGLQSNSDFNFFCFSSLIYHNRNLIDIQYDVSNGFYNWQGLFVEQKTSSIRPITDTNLLSFYLKIKIKSVYKFLYFDYFQLMKYDFLEKSISEVISLLTSENLDRKIFNNKNKLENKSIIQEEYDTASRELYDKKYFLTSLKKGEFVIRSLQKFLALKYKVLGEVIISGRNQFWEPIENFTIKDLSDFLVKEKKSNDDEISLKHLNSYTHSYHYDNYSFQFKKDGIDFWADFYPEINKEREKYLKERNENLEKMNKILFEKKKIKTIKMLESEGRWVNEKIEDRIKKLIHTIESIANHTIEIVEEIKNLQDLSKNYYKIEHEKNSLLIDKYCHLKKKYPLHTEHVYSKVNGYEYILDVLKKLLSREIILRKDEKGDFGMLGEVEVLIERYKVLRFFRKKWLIESFWKVKNISAYEELKPVIDKMNII